MTPEEYTTLRSLLVRLRKEHAREASRLIRKACQMHKLPDRPKGLDDWFIRDKKRQQLANNCLIGDVLALIPEGF